uniref:Golgi SNAP receptor complex member 1 n=1 Tax=Globisporangium ultimum (strain ATCC 200006 / CBS 805.95 / DAOM BR144) TaxID=431595 RepID=K3WQC3_GLOUD
MMQTSTQSWEELRRAARTAERHLEDKIAAYTTISKTATRATTEYDVEDPPADTANERQLALDIENTLTTLSDTINEMSAFVSTSSLKTHEAVLQRYRELYFDFKTEFRRSMSTLQEKRDAQKLFGNRSAQGTSEDAEMDSLLNERRALDSSRSMTSSIIDQALETKNSLDSQRSRFTNSRSKMNTVSNSFAGINSLVAQIRRKKLRNNTILALVIAACVCFTLWWTVLSKT